MTDPTILEFGNKDSKIILIQPIDEHDNEEIKNEYHLIKEMTSIDFRLIAIKVNDWNKDLSPWKATAVFGKEDFGDGANLTLEKILEMIENDKRYYLGGYSLAGLFSLWAAYQTDRFNGIVASSASVWFEHFLEYMQENKIKTKSVYLSLGNKEAKTKNKVMATVADKMSECYELLKESNVDCTFQWNQGNHFKDASLRTAKGFAWLLEKEKKIIF